MTLPDHEHICTVCGNTTVYHVHDHESEGDIVDAFCDECNEDTDHRIGDHF